MIRIIILIALLAAPRPAQQTIPDGTPRASGTPAASTPASLGMRAVPPEAAPLPPAAVLRGFASWCAPTPRYCTGWGGLALVGALPSFRSGDLPYTVKVCTSSACVRVGIVSYCACGTHVIDLSPAAFKRLAPLSRGIVRVVVTTPHLTAPATDTTP